MSRSSFYRFRSVWTLDCHPTDAYLALCRLDSYPQWWPEVREAHRLDGGRVELRCRSLLPYDLRFVVEQGVVDPAVGLVEAGLAGDLEGFSRWTVTAAAAGSQAVFEEEVVTNKGALNRLAPVARPAFRANHALMMRHGQAGLRVFLAGVRLGRSMPLSDRTSPNR
ncbi:MAG: polyketide cyclase [Actinobacteria bacterium]|nr:polyketide cyclase [Actinomycetota bacterium]